MRSAVNAAAAGGEAARRIAAEAGREYILQKEDDAQPGKAASTRGFFDLFLGRGMKPTVAGPAGHCIEIARPGTCCGHNLGWPLSLRGRCASPAGPGGGGSAGAAAAAGAAAGGVGAAALPELEDLEIEIDLEGLEGLAEEGAEDGGEREEGSPSGDNDDGMEWEEVAAAPGAEGPGPDAQPGGWRVPGLGSNTWNAVVVCSNWSLGYVCACGICRSSFLRLVDWRTGNGPLSPVPQLAHHSALPHLCPPCACRGARCRGGAAAAGALAAAHVAAAALLEPGHGVQEGAHPGRLGQGGG